MHALRDFLPNRNTLDPLLSFYNPMLSLLQKLKGSRFAQISKHHFTRLMIHLLRIVQSIYSTLGAGALESDINELHNPLEITAA